MHPSKRLTFVGLGEVLFDVFEDGAATLGGAPLNVAVHAHQLASALDLGEGLVVSRIGKDQGGRDILSALADRGMSTRYIQTDNVRPTGRVSVFMSGGEPGYQINAGAAWDFLEPNDALDELAAKCDAVCFGSLAQRSPVSRGAVRRFLRDASRAVRLYDVNLRRNSLTNEPGYSAEIIEASCELATVMKLNGSELAEICRMFDLPCGGIEDGLRALLGRFPVEAVVLTRGAEGTKLYTRAGEFIGNAAPVPVGTAYPVGAGDACSAGILFAMVLGWRADDAIDLANRMGAWVASQLSATPPLPEAVVALARQLTRARAAV